jgi:hypothetical protein
MAFMPIATTASAIRHATLWLLLWAFQTPLQATARRHANSIESANYADECLAGILEGQHCLTKESIHLLQKDVQVSKIIRSKHDPKHHQP